MNGRDIVTRMRSIEDNISGETGEDNPPLDRAAAKLLDIEENGLAEVLNQEAERTVMLLRTWYKMHGITPNNLTAAQLGILQGITFAVAVQRMRKEAENPSA